MGSENFKRDSSYRYNSFSSFFFLNIPCDQSSQKLLLGICTFRILKVFNKRLKLSLAQDEWGGGLFQNATRPTVVISFSTKTFSECSL